MPVISRSAVVAMSLSRSPGGGIIDGSGQSAYERWELPSMSAGEQRAKAERPEVEEMAVESVQPLTAEQLAEIEQQARDEGFEQGRHEGLQAARNEVDATMQRLEQVIQQLAEPLQAVEEQVEQELLQLAFAIARQVVRRELQQQPEQVIAVVREALAALPSAAARVTIQLHPEDAQLVREQFAPADDEDAQRAWRVVDDLTLQRGDCRIESDTSRIDATVEKRLNSVIAELLGGTRSGDDDGE